jgi:hypothetical protein
MACHLRSLLDGCVLPSKAGRHEHGRPRGAGRWQRAQALGGALGIASQPIQHLIDVLGAAGFAFCVAHVAPHAEGGQFVGDGFPEAVELGGVSHGWAYSRAVV